MCLYLWLEILKNRVFLSIMRDPQKCPRCGMGKDTDGDGDCAVCSRYVDKKNDVLSAIFRMLDKEKKCK
jgi:hypothetical protein